MSWQAVTWVLENSQATLGSRLVLLSIASHANREGKQAWPSVETIALECRLSRRDVFYCLQQLQETGELRVISGRKKTGNVSNRYELPLVEKWLKTPTPSAKVAPPLVNALHPPGESIAPEPFLNRPIEPSEEKTTKTIILVGGEPSQNLSHEMQACRSRRLLRKAARKMKPQAPKSWEQQKAELREKGFLA